MEWGAAASCCTPAFCPEKFCPEKFISDRRPSRPRGSSPACSRGGGTCSPGRGSLKPGFNFAVAKEYTTAVQHRTAIGQNYLELGWIFFVAVFVIGRPAPTICVALLFSRCSYLRLDAGMDVSGFFTFLYFFVFVAVFIYKALRSAVGFRPLRSLTRKQ